MPKIKQLSPQQIAQIAAGEVIERPAYAIKELIDNSLDAGATKIHIVLEQSGLEKIVVTDDGEGMDEADVKISFLPHTTSKLITDHMLGIKTFGFRGEALASIASMSTLTIQSKTQNVIAGTEVRIRSGKLDGITKIGMAKGTKIIVDALFSSVPARKKFLKSLPTELRHSIDIISGFILAHPDISFYVEHNKRTYLDLPKNQQLKERIAFVLGNNTIHQLIPISYTDSFVRVDGFISTPQLTNSTVSKQFIYINKRRVNDKLISLSLKEAYGALLPPSIHPYCVLFISLPFEQVDVNIHPRKEQVNLVSQRLVFDVVYRAVTSALSENNLTLQTVNWLPQNVTPKITKTHAAQILKNEIATLANKISTRNKSAEIIQLHNVYLVTETENGILLTDQHAAHERILYEQYLDAFQNQKKRGKIHKLPKPLHIPISLADKELLSEKKHDLVDIEFNFEIKNNQLIISHVPEFFKDRNIEEFVKEIMSTMAEGISTISHIDSHSHTMLAYLACRSAVKAGDVLSMEQRKEILDELSKTKNRYTCPHGRPTQIEVSLTDLNHSFKR